MIYGPKNVDYDADLGPVMISDWYHEYYFANVQKTLANPASGQEGPPLADNNLINGKTSNGGSGIATLNVVCLRSDGINISDDMVYCNIPVIQDQHHKNPGD